jgi:putative DNA primase/helicase
MMNDTVPVMAGALDQFRASLVAAGLVPPDVIVADGTLHRFASDGRPGDDAGWYVANAGPVYSGVFGCWRRGIEQTWRERVGRQLTQAERAELSSTLTAARREALAVKNDRYAEGAALAQRIWSRAAPASGDQAYLVAKGVAVHGIRQTNGELVIPARDRNGTLRSLQFIASGGKKRFLKDGRIAGCFHVIGEPEGILCIAEGYATAASIYEATGHAVAITFSANFLEVATIALRAKYPDVRIIVCADDDRETDENPGVREARKAAMAVGGVVCVPELDGDEKRGALDFNDVARYFGAEAIRTAIARARTRELPGLVKPRAPTQQGPISGA